MALRLLTSDANHLMQASQLLSEGKVGVMAFNGVYGIFGDIDRVEVSDRIMEIKNRPEDKKLILTTAPEHLHAHVDFSNLPYTQKQIEKLQKNLHALGIILPASEKAAKHIVSPQNTVLNIWTEYVPLRTIVNDLHKKGMRGLVGTSANKSGQPTVTDGREAHDVFKDDVDFILEDDFSELPAIRRQSTSVIDLTGETPRLHRLGNVTEDEIREALSMHGFPELAVDTEKTIYVKKK